MKKKIGERERENIMAEVEAGKPSGSHYHHCKINGYYSRWRKKKLATFIRTNIHQLKTIGQDIKAQFH